MQPLGYYGLSLDPSTDIAIDNLRLHELVDTLNNMSTALNTKHYIDNDDVPAIMEASPIDPDGLSDTEKIALIRGLCDRIEIKLMEAAN
ncbi:hypothetical protein [Pseudanabaena sp. BC1403]|uniref:hypothetical protein n=1 Tax=Pseudanabaena sp. BC1403 TaxID=2043171 RepID=UPI000CD812FA|nr:hypothetical protein [Pseudanabaena sp. BC1403]